MVSPIYIIIVLLGLSFLMGLFNKTGFKAAWAIGLGSLAFVSYVSLSWFLHFLELPMENVMIYTAGHKPPFSINLQIALEEALMISAVNILGFFGLMFLYDHFKEKGYKTIILFLVLIMGLNVIIMSRDIFNLFVFLEIASIALIGLIFYSKNEETFPAGFKYLIAVSVISALLLIGIGVIYFYGGTLNIDQLIAQNTMALKGFTVAAFLILITVLLELKSFPANGWALDVYQAANPGISAIISAGTATASLFMLYKLLPLGGDLWLNIAQATGIITFLGSNFLGISQKNANRLLGYSSIGQIGLMIAIIGFQDVLGSDFTFVFFAIFISHFLAKAGLFWISGVVKQTNIKDWTVLRSYPVLLFIFGAFIFTLIGFPPFPSFYGKWQLIMELGYQGNFLWPVLILVGSLFEAVYLLRWLGYTIKLDNEIFTEIKVTFRQLFPIGVFAGLLFAIAWFVNDFAPSGLSVNLIPLYFIMFLFAIDFLPAFIKNTIAIAGILLYSWNLYPDIADDTLRLVFAVIFLGGGVLTLIAGYSVKGKRPGFYPYAIMMYAGLIGLIEAKSLFEFFFSWELMTLGSYILILRGKKSLTHAYNYMLFSVGGAYLIFMGMALSAFSQTDLSIDALTETMFPAWTYSLLAIGFLTKTAALGLHIWLPGAHAEAESDVSPMVSGILLKGGVFGLVVLFLAMGGEQAAQHPLMYVLGWLGAITALIGNLMAVFQEDAKRLLAYSSIGNLGYILFGLSFMTNVGWLTAITYSMNHFLFKTLLFLAIGGVILRVKTHNMYEMGGLIKKMPWSFIAVLIGIITLAGIPPLSGYAGKWLFYNAVITKGWFIQGAIVFFAGTIAFLYCFKLIYSVFLGQPKDKFRKVKEVPIWYIIPQFILIIGIMIFSARPELVLEPIGNLLVQKNYFPTDPLTWENVTASTNLGYWSGYKIMLVIMGMFVVLLGWLLLMSRKAKKVKQFNIVYAAERPFKPETTHFSHNMFSHYYKALGFMVQPNVTRFWSGVNNTTHALANSIRKVYSGNGQTYIMHILLYIIIVYLIIS